MFQAVIKEHNQRLAAHRREIEKCKDDVVASIEAVTSALLDSVNAGVAQVYINQQRLEQEAKALQAQTARFAKQTSKWLAMYKGLNEALKELGDVKNWAKTIEADMNSIAELLDSITHPQQKTGS